MARAPFDVSPVVLAALARLTVALADPNDPGLSTITSEGHE